MENEIIDKTTKDNPSYFGAYLNLATSNAYNVLAHINDTFIGKGTQGGEANMHKMFFLEYISSGNGLNKEQLSSIFRAINKYFPFLTWMVQGKLHSKKIQESPSEQHLHIYVEILTTLLSNLLSYRNFYTHCIGGNPQEDKSLINYLYSAFENSRKLIRERFKYSADDVHHLVRYTEKASKNRKEAKTFYYSFLDKNKTISDNGLIYLTCLFLRPRESQLFLKQIKRFKKSDEQKYKATFHCFTTNCIRLPGKALTSDNSFQGVQLDILNELRKCPGLLFKHLSKENQERFRPSTTSSEDDSLLVNPVLLKRYGNRFVELLAKFLDRKEAFPNLRFLVKYGRFYYRHDEKTFFDEKYNRWLTKDLYAFSRLSDIEEFKNELRDKNILKKTFIAPVAHIKDKKPKPYIDDREAEFIVANNQVLISLIPRDPEISKILSQDGQGQYKRPKGVEMDNNVISISIYDLPGLLLYYLLTNNSYKVEGALQSWRKNFLRFIKDVRDAKITPTSILEHDSSLSKHDNLSRFLITEYNLKSADIPDSIRKYLLGEGKKDDETEKKIRRILKSMIQETNALLDKAAKEIDFRKENINRHHKIIESGKLADHLARDMVYFICRVPALKSIRKPNASEFQQLQKIMAFWGKYPNELIPMMKSMNVFDYHPFLNEEDVKNVEIYTFFNTYFSKKIHYLNRISGMSEIKLENVVFLNINISRDVSNICNDIMNKHHLLLPRGFFNDLCRGEVNNKTAGNLSQNVSIGHMAEKYLEHISGKKSDITQPFYDLPRVYDFINKWTDTRTKKDRGKSMPINETSIGERRALLGEIITWLKTGEDQKKMGQLQKPKSRDVIKSGMKGMLKSEQIIRLVKLQDQLLFKCVIDSLQEESGLKGLDQFTLSDIEIALDKSIKYTLEYGKAGHRITDNQMKIKDYGKFQSLLRDRRIIKLIHYFNKDREIERQDLIRELENYEKYRVEILKMIYLFEEKMVSKYEEHFNVLRITDDGGVVQHKHFLVKLESEGKIDKEQHDNMKMLRNAFSHNEYPDSAENKMKINSDEGIAEQFYEYTEKYYLHNYWSND